LLQRGRFEALFASQHTEETGAIQEMATNWSEISNVLAIAIIALFLFGVLYNQGIEKWPWLAQRRPAEQVIGGVLITVLVSGLIIGVEDMLIIMLLFAASGFPMLIGSWVRAAKDDAEAKRIAHEVLKK
jgi:hypothetical protein